MHASTSTNSAQLVACVTHRSSRRRRVFRVAWLAIMLAAIGNVDLVVGNSPAYQPAVSKQYIVASGIKGTLIVCGTGDVSSEAIDQFSKSVGDKKGRVVILGGPEESKDAQANIQGLKEKLDAKGLASVDVVRIPSPESSKEDALELLKKANGAACNR